MGVGREIMLKIFVSHASSDTWIAEQVAAKIEDCGAYTFLDSRDLLLGDDVEMAIKRARTHARARNAPSTRAIARAGVGEE